MSRSSPLVAMPSFLIWPSRLLVPSWLSISLHLLCDFSLVSTVFVAESTLVIASCCWVGVAVARVGDVDVGVGAKDGVAIAGIMAKSEPLLLESWPNRSRCCWSWGRSQSRFTTFVVLAMSVLPFLPFGGHRVVIVATSLLLWMSPCYCCLVGAST